MNFRPFTLFFSLKARPHRAIKQGIFLRFCGVLSIADHRRPSQVSPRKSQQRGQPAAHDGMFSLSPAIFIAAMAIRNINLILCHTSHESWSNAHQNAANRLRIGQ